MKSNRSSINQPIDRSINQSVDHERKSYKKRATISIPICCFDNRPWKTLSEKACGKDLRTVFLATKLATHLWNNLCERREFTLLRIKINDRFSFLSLIPVLFCKRIKNVSLCFCTVREFETLEEDLEIATLGCVSENFSQLSLKFFQTPACVSVALKHQKCVLFLKK